MMIFSKSETPSLSEIESLLLVQESPLDKFRQELVVNATANATPNVVQASARSGSGYDQANARTQGVQGNSTFGFQLRGRGRQGRTRGRGRGTPPIGNKPTCQLCARYGHPILDC